MGKPRSIDPTGKKCGDAPITVRFTTAQVSLLKKEARKCGMGLSELVRLCIFSNKKLLETTKGE